MIRDTATPWVRHILIPNTWTCSRCGVTLHPGDSVSEGEIFAKDGRTLFGQQPPYGFLECQTLERQPQQ